MAGELQSAVLVRSWRTAFLTLRDETLSHPADPLASLHPMLDELIFSQFQSFIAAAAYLPHHEVGFLAQWHNLFSFFVFLPIHYLHVVY